MSFFGLPLQPIADAFGIPVAAVEFFLAVLLISGAAVGLHALTKSMTTSIVGGVVMFAISLGMGLIPFWFIVFLVLILGAVFVTINNAGGVHG